MLLIQVQREEKWREGGGGDGRGARGGGGGEEEEGRGGVTGGLWVEGAVIGSS